MRLRLKIGQALEPSEHFTPSFGSWQPAVRLRVFMPSSSMNSGTLQARPTSLPLTAGALRGYVVGCSSSTDP